MKFNWGHGIIVFFCIFISFMAYLAIRSNQQNIDLVADDYYAQEVRYQQRIDKINNARKLAEPVKIKREGQGLLIRFPKLPAAISGQVHLFRPSDQQFDRLLTLQPDEANQQRIPLQGLPRGHYRLKIDWQAGGVPYYTEETVFLE